jgi:hypothetical protein
VTGNVQLTRRALAISTKHTFVFVERTLVVSQLIDNVSHRCVTGQVTIHAVAISAFIISVHVTIISWHGSAVALSALGAFHYNLQALPVTTRTGLVGIVGRRSILYVYTTCTLFTAELSIYLKRG